MVLDGWPIHCARHRNQILIRWRTPLGKNRTKSIRWSPTYYMPPSSPGAIPSGLTTLHGEPLQAATCKTLFEADNFKKQLEKAGRGLYGDVPYINAFLVENFPHIAPLDKDTLDIAYIDIETDSSNGYATPLNPTAEIQMISIRRRGHTTTYGTKPYTPTRKDVTFRQCANEVELLSAFMEDWTSNYPDVVTGWNCLGYDMAYIYYRLRLVFAEDLNVALSLSPWGLIRDQKIRVGMLAEDYIDIVGVPVLDYIHLYRKFNQNQQSSYTLNHIAKVELGIEKVKFDDEYENLTRLYNENYPLFVDYNLTDVDLVEKLEQKRNMVRMVATMGHQAHVNFMDTFKQVRMWDIMIYQHLLEKNIAVPPRQQTVKDTQYAGAYVKDTLVGKFNWVVSFDVTSLYPSLMRQWSISPDTFIPPEVVAERATTSADWATVKMLQESISVEKAMEWLEDPAMVQTLEVLQRLGVTITPNQQVFDTTRPGFMGEILGNLFQSRMTWKKKQLAAEKVVEDSTTPEDVRKESVIAASVGKTMQEVAKVGLNSAYGASGSQYFRFFDTRLAEAVTLSGQLVTRIVERRLNRSMNKWLKTTDVDYVIASDTDSVYINLGAVSAKLPPTDDMATAIDAFATKWIQPLLNKTFASLYTVYRGHQNLLSMKREVIVDSGIWMKKKMYVMSVLDSEGVRYPKAKIKIKGLKTVRSTTSALTKSLLSRAFEIMLYGTEQQIWTLVEEAEQKYAKATFDELASPTGVNGLEKYIKRDKGIPGHVKAALTYNRLLEELQLTAYTPIRSGDKIRWVYLGPNPWQIESIAVQRRPPAELNIEPYISRVVILEKTFLKPLTDILDELKWSARPKTSLEDLFE